MTVRCLSSVVLGAAKRLYDIVPSLAPTFLVAVSACQMRDVQSADSASTVAALADSVPSRNRDAGVPDAPIVRTSGQDSTTEYYTAAALAHVGDSLARGTSTGHTLHAHPTYQYLQIRRTRSGVPEVHDRWIDVTTVQSGRGTLLSGGHVTGSRAEAGGEHRDGTIVGGASRPVGPGDLMIIPAGVPHQYLIAPGDSLRYLTVKVLQPSAGR
jgi:mannose-6-phosphate isomerase-like protein (cupin superfamily)